MGDHAAAKVGTPARVIAATAPTSLVGGETPAPPLDKVEEITGAAALAKRARSPE
jgi:hypothetical protein